MTEPTKNILVTCPHCGDEVMKEVRYSHTLFEKDVYTALAMCPSCMKRMSIVVRGDDDSTLSVRGVNNYDS